RLAVARMNGGRIAVVVTCRDLGRTLVEALDSVRNQTRLASEIIVVDDASTDVYTRQALAQIEREGQRVVRTSGQGAAAARNAGVRITSSEYLVRGDGDDGLVPAYVAAAAARLGEDGCPYYGPRRRRGE